MRELRHICFVDDIVDENGFFPIMRELRRNLSILNDENILGFFPIMRELRQWLKNAPGFPDCRFFPIMRELRQISYSFDLNIIKEFFPDYEGIETALSGQRYSIVILVFSRL